jgi:beta-lactam-binding protein with PASTA domain
MSATTPPDEPARPADPPGPGSAPAEPDAAASRGSDPAATDPPSGAGALPGEGKQPMDPRRRTLLIVVGGLLLALVIVAIVIVVAKPKQKLVPAVVGTDLVAATEVLDDAGFDVRAKRVVNVGAVGKVLGQDPEGGVKADDGSTVALTVSGGPGEGTVPDVSGLPEPKARAALESAGYQPSDQKQFSTAVPSGNAISTDPEGGTRRRKDTPVTLVISKGPQTVAVPDVAGDTENAAKAALQQAGLKVQVNQQRSNQSPGDVLSQSPAAGDVVVLGSVVEIIVDKAPVPVQVPNVVGKPVEDATSTLSSLGLAVYFRSKVVDDPSQNDIVLAQQPAGGTKASPGSNVILQVAKYQSGPAPPPNPPTTATTATTATSATTTTSTTGTDTTP